MPYSNSHVEPQFEPPCDEKPDAWKTETGVCSGRYLTNVSIVDWLTVPKTTPGGDYVLQLRYDCEVRRPRSNPLPPVSSDVMIDIDLAPGCDVHYRSLRRFGLTALTCISKQHEVAAE
eukprot:SAG22_NODE_5808_length_949_cov_1.107059_1_plen_117_part_10